MNNHPLKNPETGEVEWIARNIAALVMIIGVNKDGTYLASDIPAILKYTKNVYYIGNMEAACLKKDKVT